MTQTKWPFGNADIQTPAFAATLAVTVNDNKTIVNVDQMTGDMTVNLTINAELPAGAEMQMRLESDGTARDVTLGTGFSGNVISGTISKTNIASFVYDGSTFLHTGTQQID